MFEGFANAMQKIKNVGQKVWNVGEKISQLTISVGKSLCMGIASWGGGGFVIELLISIALKRRFHFNKDIERDCDAYHFKIAYDVVEVTTIIALLMLLAYTKYRQTNYKTSSKQFSLLLRKDPAPAATLEKIGSIPFIPTDSALNGFNAFLFYELVSEYLGIPLSLAIFILLVNQNIKFTNQVLNRPTCKMHQGIGGILTDIAGVLARAFVAKTAVHHFIAQQGYSATKTTILQTLNIANILELVVRWTNYQATGPEQKEKYHPWQFAAAIILTISYIIPDSTLYAKTLTDWLFFKKAVHCKDFMLEIFLALAFLEGWAYYNKILQTTPYIRKYLQCLLPSNPVPSPEPHQLPNNVEEGGIVPFSPLI